MNNMPEPYLRLHQYMSHYVEISPDAWQHFKQLSEVLTFSKNEIIEAFNAPATRLHFVVDGFARHYFVDENQNEVTIWLSEPGGLSTDYAAFTRRDQSLYQIQALTPLTTVSINNDQLQVLYDEYKAFERLGRLVNQQYLNDFIERNNFLVRFSARQRFDFLMAHKPHFFNIVPLRHLASYMNVTSETLSRLRSDSY